MSFTYRPIKVDVGGETTSPTYDAKKGFLRMSFCPKASTFGR
jgi:hypothetical protein